MKQIALLLAAAAASLALAGPARAATLGVYSQDYGSGNGRIDPPGNSQLRGNHVLIGENDSRPFLGSFDFSDLAGATIDSIALTLTYDRAGPAVGGLLELWYVDILGSVPNSFVDNFYEVLDDTASPLTLTISAATDTGGTDAFATTLANMRLDFSFAEESALVGNSFRLFSAALTVNGTAASAVVPLPAPGLLLLGALGGLALMRRRRTQAAAPAA